MNIEAVVTENAKPTTWNDVIAASAEAQREEPELETITDTINVPITEAMLIRIAKDNAADDLEKNELDLELDSLKEQVKARKAKVEEIEKRMGDRHEAVRNGVQSLKGQWLIREVFERNAVQYLDPTSREVVLERSMTPGERQTELAFDDDEQAAQGLSALDAEDLDDEGFDDSTNVTDPEGIVDGAGTGTESSPEVSTPPEKPIKRTRRSHS